MICFLSKLYLKSIILHVIFAFTKVKDFLLTLKYLFISSILLIKSNPLCLSDLTLLINEVQYALTNCF